MFNMCEIAIEKDFTQQMAKLAPTSYVSGVNAMKAVTFAHFNCFSVILSITSGDIVVGCYVKPFDGCEGEPCRRTRFGTINQLSMNYEAREPKVYL